MKGPIQRILASWLTLCAIAFAVSACGPGQPPQPVKHIPNPVTERGMTLDWGTDVKTQALRLIRSSSRYCYVDVYELSDPDVIQALINAWRRRVDVRVIVDATETHSQTVGLPMLQKAGVPIQSLRIPHGISHIKLLISDGGVLIGGMNFGAESWNNNDASVYIRHPNLSFLALFHWDWLRAQGQPAAAPEYILPLIDDRKTESHVIEAIRHAKHTIYIEAFELSDWPVLDALKGALKRGVLVEVLLNPGQLPNEKSATELRDEGATVRFYRPYHNEWMHAKILDVDRGAVFIIGSANFSHQAYTYNHEGDIEIRGVPRFNESLEDDLSVQIARGTDYPIHKQHFTLRWKNEF